MPFDHQHLLFSFLIVIFHKDSSRVFLFCHICGSLPHVFIWQEHLNFFVSSSWFYISWSATSSLLDLFIDWKTVLIIVWKQVIFPLKSLSTVTILVHLCVPGVGNYSRWLWAIDGLLIVHRRYRWILVGFKIWSASFFFEFRSMF